jgi:hypothetical protein
MSFSPLDINMAKRTISMNFSVAQYVFEMPVDDLEMMIENGFLVKGDAEDTVLCDYDDQRKLFTLVRAQMESTE